MTIRKNLAGIAMEFTDRELELPLIEVDLPTTSTKEIDATMIDAAVEESVPSTCLALGELVATIAYDPALAVPIGGADELVTLTLATGEVLKFSGHVTQRTGTKAGIADRPTMAVTVKVNATQLAAPTISPAGGAIYDNEPVTIEAPAGAIGFYTIDDSDPATDGVAFTDAITLPAGTITVRAISRRDGYLDSEEAEETFAVTVFSLVDPALWRAFFTFDTNLQSLALGVVAGWKSAYAVGLGGGTGAQRVGTAGPDAVAGTMEPYSAGFVGAGTPVHNTEGGIIAHNVTKWSTAWFAKKGGGDTGHRGWSPAFATENDNFTYGLIYTHPGGGDTNTFRGLSLDLDAVGLYDGNWHHYALVYDGDAATMKVYRDGVLMDTATLTGAQLSMPALKYVGFHVENQGTKGIDNIAQYEGVLSLAAIQALAAGNRPDATTGLLSA